MRRALAIGALLAAVASGRHVAADTVTDESGDFTMEIADPGAQLCTVVPVGGSAGACTEKDRASAHTYASDPPPVRVVVAHFEGWEARVIVTKAKFRDPEVSQSAADVFARELRDTVRKQLPQNLELIDGDRPAHASILHVEGVPIFRATVQIAKPLAVAPSGLSYIAYEVVGRDASYTVQFASDLAHFDAERAFAQRTIESVRTLSAPSTPPAPGADQAGQAAPPRGKRWAWLSGGAAVLVLAYLAWRGRSRRG